MPTQILHGAHKEHPMVLGRIGNVGFRCNGCGCDGVGFSYCCDACDFDLHEFCATCLPTASFAFHGQHRLTLELSVVPNEDRFCSLCDSFIKGMHYSCRQCGFDVHPVCSQLPGAAVSPLHPEHLLMLTADVPRKCTRCKTICLWRYRCDPCGVNLHPRCLLGSDKTPLNIPEGTGSRLKDQAGSSGDEVSGSD